ncbi:Thioredoxin H-type [Hibiscus syriacus]|uniref:Thioredoxin H-type n=1 Tax=Hibiscus syriacus TaxID=106335 RepID=A0A6A3BUV4_HIBSY|nr:thioredoxin O1, mitochondrial-like [Hibiscus syriacus]KAE8719671.1 Thioredoxin H-type [Hibiscus syriacus]
MRGQSILRPFLLRQAYNVRSISSSSSRIPLAQSNLISASEKNPSISKTPFSGWTPRNPNLLRSFSDFSPDFFKPSFLENEPEPVPVPDNFVSVKTEEEFDAAVARIEGESVPSVLYFTATWCAPCRFIGPVMEELARRTPEVTIYKIDIDEKSLACKLEELNVKSVPTLRYFKEGKKEDEVVGADASRIVCTMQRLYNMIDPKKDDDLKDENESSKEQVTSEEDDKAFAEAMEQLCKMIDPKWWWWFKRKGRVKGDA